MLGKASDAYRTLQAVKTLSAFTITHHVARKRLNQWATEYQFPDDSLLVIYRQGFARSFLSRDGDCDCVSEIRCARR